MGEPAGADLQRVEWSCKRQQFRVDAGDQVQSRGWGEGAVEPGQEGLLFSDVRMAGTAVSWRVRDTMQLMPCWPALRSPSSALTVREAAA